jgi:hypothetical protein
LIGGGDGGDQKIADECGDQSINDAIEFIRERGHEIKEQIDLMEKKCQAEPEYLAEGRTVGDIEGE